MKKVFCILLFVLLSVNANAQKKWYQGGTLHSATLYEWKQSSERNKLATISDWIVVVFKNHKKPITSTNSIKEKAKEVRKCTNRRISKFRSITNLKVLKANEIAYKCMVDLGYLK